jgi:opacity protein-like surface antigen
VTRKLAVMAAVGVLAGSAAWAQDPRVEISGTAGWTFSDGVSGASEDVPGVGTFNRIDPKDSFSWGLRVGFLVTEEAEVGFLFDQQPTTLQISGTSKFDIGDMSVRNYHGYFAYNFGDGDAAVRPYLLIGLGATQFGTIRASVGGVQRDISGDTRFSGTGGLGVKLFPSPHFGLRLEGRWTPTYIKSDAVGWWCYPYWGCYLVGNAQYANQFELSGGLTLRF